MHGVGNRKERKEADGEGGAYQRRLRMRAEVQGQNKRVWLARQQFGRERKSDGRVHPSQTQRKKRGKKMQESPKLISPHRTFEVEAQEKGSNIKSFLGEKSSSGRRGTRKAEKARYASRTRACGEYAEGNSKGV